MAKRVKVFAIVGLTLAWLFWELWANFDSDPDTWPLTWVVVRYVPAWITLPAVLVLAIWLPWHFWSNYRDKMREAAVTPLATTSHVSHLDALNRAFRTFVQGLAVDVVAAVTLVLTAQLGDLHWTKAWWAALGVLLVKTAVSTAVAYASRRLKPPPAALTVSSKTL